MKFELVLSQDGFFLFLLESQPRRQLSIFAQQLVDCSVEMLGTHALCEGGVQVSERVRLLSFHFGQFAMGLEVFGL